MLQTRLLLLRFASSSMMRLTVLLSILQVSILSLVSPIELEWWMSSKRAWNHSTLLQLKDAEKSDSLMVVTCSPVLLRVTSISTNSTLERMEIWSTKCMEVLLDASIGLMMTLVSFQVVGTVTFSAGSSIPTKKIQTMRIHSTFTLWRISNSLVLPINQIPNLSFMLQVLIRPLRQSSLVISTQLMKLESIFLRFNSWMEEELSSQVSLKMIDQVLFKSSIWNGKELLKFKLIVYLLRESEFLMTTNSFTQPVKMVFLELSAF